jgi:hypothetical protein
MEPHFGSPDNRGKATHPLAKAQSPPRTQKRGIAFEFPLGLGVFAREMLFPNPLQ